MLGRLVAYWVYGGALGALLLLLLSPLFIQGWTPVVAATFYCLPAYMLHQYEEHDNDRFRVFVNELLGGGREVLTPTAVFNINIFGVWGVIAVALWLTRLVHPGFALVAAYLLVLNAVIHIVQGAATRSYNPGLVSAIVLFLPVGGWCFYASQHAGGGTLPMHIIGLACAIAIHLAIALPVLNNRRRLALQTEATRSEAGLRD
jgi:hypothetical protein